MNQKRRRGGGGGGVRRWTPRPLTSSSPVGTPPGPPLLFGRKRAGGRDASLSFLVVARILEMPQHQLSLASFAAFHQLQHQANDVPVKSNDGDESNISRQKQRARQRDADDEGYEPAPARRRRKQASAAEASPHGGLMKFFGKEKNDTTSPKNGAAFEAEACVVADGSHGRRRVRAPQKRQVSSGVRQTRSSICESPGSDHASNLDMAQNSSVGEPYECLVKKGSAVLDSPGRSDKQCSASVPSRRSLRLSKAKQSAATIVKEDSHSTKDVGPPQGSRKSAVPRRVAAPRASIRRTMRIVDSLCLRQCGVKPSVVRDAYAECVAQRGWQPVRTFRPMDAALVPYDIYWGRGGGSIAAAGSRGLCAVWNCPSPLPEADAYDEEDWDAPVALFTAHTRWISNVRFAGCNDRLLLTSSDDASVALWNMEELFRGAGLNGLGAVQPLQRQSGVHGGGIYSMDVLDSSCMRNERVIDGFHNGVVKSGSWRDECVFATSGNDRTLSVFDRRAGGRVTALADIHRLSVNSVKWNPLAPHQVITASFDKSIHVYDLRGPNLLHNLESHDRRLCERAQSMHHPFFILGGTLLATTADKSYDLHLYSGLDTGAPRHAKVDFGQQMGSATALCGGAELASVIQRRLVVFRPDLR